MTNKNKRPRRQKKGDRLLGATDNKAEIKCDYAVAPLDRLAIKMDRKWGVDRLTELVSVETATKYGSAVAKLNAALDANDVEEVKRRAAVCMRGLAAMDKEAEEAGQPQASPDVIEYEVDGFKFGIMPDASMWQTVKEARPDLKLFTLREVGNILKDISGSPVFEAVKQHFPQAEIKAVRPKKETLEDEIPW